MRIAKARSGIPSVSHQEALEAALCYGWIDGQGRSYDRRTWLLKFVPRRPGSIWSKVNREKAKELIRTGRMKPAGMRAVTQAMETGRWKSAYDSPGRAKVPRDLQTALDRNPRAGAFFTTLDSRNRYAILHRLQTAKKRETRAKRLALFVRMLAGRKKIHP